MFVLGPCDPLGAAPRAGPTGLPSRTEARAACDHVAARGLAILPVLVETGMLDANNDGVPDAVRISDGGGTLRWEQPEFRPRGAAKDTAAIATTPEEGFQPGDYLPLGARWLRLGGRVYTLYFEAEDERHASYLGIIDAHNIEHLVCDFANVETETLHPVGGRDADGVCRAVARGKVSYSPVAELTDADPAIDPERERTSVGGRATVDFANTGTPARLARLDYEGQGGRVCQFSYFDLIATDRIVSSGDAHATLMQVQDVALDDDRGGCDAYGRRWFTFGGRTYADIAPQRDHAYVPPFHAVRLAQAGKVETRCTGSFAVHWRVKSMGPTFR